MTVCPLYYGSNRVCLTTVLSMHLVDGMFEFRATCRLSVFGCLYMMADSVFSYIFGLILKPFR